MTWKLPENIWKEKVRVRRLNNEEVRKGGQRDQRKRRWEQRGWRWRRQGNEEERGKGGCQICGVSCFRPSSKA